MTASTHFDVLDLRHLAAAQLRPLLEDEARRWELRLHWDYRAATATLLEYLDARVLPGYVALRGDQPIGYTFSVLEAEKAVLGDVYAYGETEQLANPVCETLLHHQIETLQATPGLVRIESQLLMFPQGALASPFLARGFRSFPRQFMTRAATTAGPSPAPPALPAHLRLLPWTEDCYQPAGELIHRAYRTHIDSQINDQYQTVHGSLRFLHNIVRFPGCGVFDAHNSWVLRNAASGALAGLILASRVREDAGHITQLCIAPELRGQKLGRLLLDRTLTHFAQRNIPHVSLTVTTANAEARHLYETFGFTTRHTFEAMVWSPAAD